MCDRPDVYRESIVRARKPYKCCECGWLIAVGEAHRYCWGVYDGEASAHRMCTDCHAVVELVWARDADSCLTFGGLWGHVSGSEMIQELPDVEAFVARVRYRHALRWRDRALARATAAQHPTIERIHEKRANQHAWEWIRARDELVAAGKLPAEAP